METISGGSLEVVTGGDEDDARASEKPFYEVPSSVNKVLSNDDLLIEILLLLPVISLVLFKSVSKRWLSIIMSPTFTFRRSQIPHLDPPSGFFLVRPPTKLCDFVSFDSRITANKSPLNTTFTEAGSKFVMIQSCNGLVLCCIKGQGQPGSVYHVYNPCMNMFKTLPQWHNYASIHACGTRMAFDPTESPHYKIVHASRIYDPYELNHSTEIQIYSSETGILSVCGDHFPRNCFKRYIDGICWNSAIHWLNNRVDEPFHFMLDIRVDEHPVLTTIQTPLTLNGKMHRNRKLCESRGCLLLLCSENMLSREMNIYKMSKGYSEWSIKYVVNIDEVALSEIVYFCFWSIVLGERDEDSYMVIDLSGKVVEYKIVSKTLRSLCHRGSADPLCWFLFIASFAHV